MNRKIYLILGTALLGLSFVIAMLAACGIDPSVPITATVEWASATATQAQEKVTATSTQCALCEPKPSPTTDELLQWWINQNGMVAFPVGSGTVARVYCKESTIADSGISCLNAEADDWYEATVDGTEYYCDWDPSFSGNSTRYLMAALCVYSGTVSYAVDQYAKAESISNLSDDGFAEVDTRDADPCPTILAQQGCCAELDQNGCTDSESVGSIIYWVYGKIYARGEGGPNNCGTSGSCTYLNCGTCSDSANLRIDIKPTPFSTPTPLPRVYVRVRSPITPGLPLPTVIVPGIGEAWRVDATTTPQWLVEENNVSEADFEVRSTPGIWEGGAIIYTTTGAIANQLRVIAVTPQPSNVVFTGTLYGGEDTFAVMWEYPPPTGSNQYSTTIIVGTPTPTPTPPFGQAIVYEGDIGAATPYPVNGIGRFKFETAGGVPEILFWTGCTDVYTCSGPLYVSTWVSRGVGINYGNAPVTKVIHAIYPTPPAGGGIGMWTGTYGADQAYTVWDGNEPTQTQWSAVFYLGTATPSPTPTPSPLPPHPYVTVTPGPMSIMKNYNVDDKSPYSDAGVAIRLYYTSSPITVTLSQPSGVYTTPYYAYAPQFSKAATGSFPVTIADGAILTFLPRDQLTRSTTVPTLTASLNTVAGVSPTIITGNTEPGFTVEIRAYRWVTVTAGTTPTHRQVVSYFYETASASGLFTATIPLTYYEWFAETWQVWHRSPSGPDQPEDVDTIWQLVPW